MKGEGVRCFLPVLRANLLVMGSHDALARRLDSLLPNLRQPVSRWAPGERLVLPPPGLLGTLIIENVRALPPRRLFEWLTMNRGTTQIISTTATSLLPLIETDAFIDTLYYRLNIVCIDAADPLGDLEIARGVNVAAQKL